jgi:hypothetical protein
MTARQGIKRGNTGSKRGRARTKNVPVHINPQPCVRGQALLAEQPLRLPIQLLDHLPGEQARVQDLDPFTHAILQKAEFENTGFFPGPAGRGREIPPARRENG